MLFHKSSLSLTQRVISQLQNKRAKPGSHLQNKIKKTVKAAPGFNSGGFINLKLILCYY